MSAVRLTFKALLEGMLLTRMAVASPAAADKSTAALMLTSASKRVWEQPAGQGWMWPWTVLKNSAVTLTAGAVAISALDYPRWVSMWSADPRGSSATGRYVPCYVDGDGIHPKDDSLGTYFVFYIPRPPEFSSTLVAVGTAYVADQIVYDDRAVADGGTGECYRCVAAYTTPAAEATLTTDLADTAKWVVQPVYKNFKSAMEYFAFADWLRQKREFQGADRMEAEALNALGDEFRKVHRQQADFMPAWARRGIWI